MPVTLRTGMAISLLPYLRSRFETRRFAFFQSGRLPHRFASNLAWLAKYMMAKRFAMTKNKYHGERFRSSSRAQRGDILFAHLCGSSGDIPVRTFVRVAERHTLMFAHLLEATRDCFSRCRSFAMRKLCHRERFRSSSRAQRGVCQLFSHPERIVRHRDLLCHRERSAAICLLVRHRDAARSASSFSHPERNCSSSRRSGDCLQLFGHPERNCSSSRAQRGDLPVRTP